MRMRLTVLLGCLLGVLGACPAAHAEDRPTRDLRGWLPAPTPPHARMLERRTRPAPGFVLANETVRRDLSDLEIDHRLHAPTPRAAGAGDAAGAAGGGGDLAKTSQNPVGDLISVPLQNNTQFGIGPHDRSGNTLNIQPVVPIPISRSVNLVTRTIIPVRSFAHFESPTGRTNGIGDINPTFFFTPAKPGKVIWGVGPTFQLPTATDARLGARRWTAGPAAVVLVMPGSWVIGALASNFFSLDDKAGEDDINLFSSQLFVNYNLPGGWFLSSAPIITADWNAPSGERWTVPVGGGFGRVTKLGKQPISWTIQGYYMLEAPTGGPEWELRIQLAFLFPKGS